MDGQAVSNLCDQMYECGQIVAHECSTLKWRLIGAGMEKRLAGIMSMKAYGEGVEEILGKIKSVEPGASIEKRYMDILESHTRDLPRSAKYPNSDWLERYARLGERLVGLLLENSGRRVSYNSARISVSSSHGSKYHIDGSVSDDDGEKWFDILVDDKGQVVSSSVRPVVPKH